MLTTLALSAVLGLAVGVGGTAAVQARQGRSEAAVAAATAEATGHTAEAARAAGEAATAAVAAATAAQSIEAQTGQLLAGSRAGLECIQFALGLEDRARAGAALLSCQWDGCLRHIEGGETGAGLGCREKGVEAGAAARALMEHADGIR